MSSYLADSTHQTAGFDALQYASDYVRRYCRQRLDYVASDTILIDPRPDHTAQLPELPVIAVSAVQAWMTGPTGSFAWQTLTNYQWTARGQLFDVTPITPPVIPTANIPYPWWPRLPESLKVTYTHGYSPIPDDLQNLVLRLAAELNANPDFVHSQKVGEINTVWAQNPLQNGAHIFLRDQDKEILDSYAVIGLS